MKVSFLEDAFDNSPEVHELTWNELIDGLSEFQFLGAGDKLKAGAFSPAEFNGGKKAEHVQAIHFGALDLDDVTLDEFTAVSAKLQGLDAFIYTTWTHAAAQRESSEPRVRARLLVRFSRAALPKEWPAVWRALSSHFGLADPACKNPDRIYFVPSMARGNETFAKTWRFRGSAWDVDSALAAAPAPEREASPFEANDPVPQELVARFAGSLVKRQDTLSVRRGNMLQAVLKGLEFAAQGGRDNALWDLAQALAEQFPRGSARSLANHFRMSLELMAEQAPDCPTVEQFQTKIERAQRNAHEARERELAEAESARGDRIALAFKSARRHPYTPEELKSFGDLRYKWIVQKDRALFVFFNGSYVGPLSTNDYAAACATFLAPSPLELSDEEGKPKSLAALVLEYGCTITEIEADLTAPRSYLAEGAHKFIEAPCPLRPLSPTFDADVAAWLELLGGRKHDALLDWIAAVTRLNRPAPALYLKGEPGTGKTLLASGLARLWSSRPTPLRSAMGDFNASILRCPLVLGDEKIPETWQGAPRTEELRELVTTSEFELNRKFLPPSTVRGALRIVLCANNLRLISSKSELTPEDARALADRFIFIQPSKSAAGWLEARGGQEFAATFVEQDRIARHALWLRDNRTIESSGRLAVPGDADELLRAMQSGSGARWNVLYWIYRYLQAPEKHVRARAGKPLAVRVKDGKILIHAASLVESWEHYLEGERAPTQQALLEALRALYDHGGRRPKIDKADYRILRLEHLVSWCELSDEDPAVIESALQLDTEKRLAN